MLAEISNAKDYNRPREKWADASGASKLEGLRHSLPSACTLTSHTPNRIHFAAEAREKSAHRSS